MIQMQTAAKPHPKNKVDSSSYESSSHKYSCPVQPPTELSYAGAGLAFTLILGSRKGSE